MMKFFKQLFAQPPKVGDVVSAYEQVTADLRKDWERRERLLREQETGKPIVRVKAGRRRIYTPEQIRSMEIAAQYSRYTQQAMQQAQQSPYFSQMASMQNYSHCR